MIPSTTAASFRQAIATIDPVQLSGIVGEVLQQAVAVTTWRTVPLGSIDFSTQASSGGVYCVWGEALTPDKQRRPWSLVVKILKSPAGFVLPTGLRISGEMAEEPASFSYWRREALLAQSGLLDDLPEGLSAPRYLAVQSSEDVIWLWQEAIGEDAPWNWADYREAARRLGLWQGRYASGEWALPEQHWLSGGWLRQWIDLPLEGVMSLFERANGWQHPLIQSCFAQEELLRLQALWADRHELVDALDALPQVVCHLDAYRSNLFWQRDVLKLVDWAFTGSGAVGEDLAAFVGGTLLLGHVPICDATHLESAALDGYLAGLRHAGWRGDQKEVESAYRWAMPLRYALMSMASMLRTCSDPDFARHWQEKSGKALPELLQHRAGFIRFML